MLTMLPINTLATEKIGAPIAESSNEEEKKAVEEPPVAEGEVDKQTPLAPTSEPTPSTRIASASGTCGKNATWSLENGTLTINGTGEMDGYYYNPNNPDDDSDPACSKAPWYSLREQIKTVVIANGISKIGMSAFFGCSGLTNATIPDSVRLIDAYAFNGCSSLLNIALPDGITDIEAYTFDGCINLTQVTIPDSVTTIGGWAFEGCSSLTSITLPKNLTLVGNYSFGYCSNLSAIELPDNVTRIENHAFAYCVKLKSAIIPHSVEYIGWDAFTHCYELTDVYYGGSENDWNTINKVDNDRLEADDITIHYADGMDTSIGTKRIGFYSPLGKRIFGINTEWGWDLFLKHSSSTYNYSLAKIALTLSGAAEDSQATVEDILLTGGAKTDDNGGNKLEGLGFDPDLILSQYYEKEWYEVDHPAVTFGHKNIVHSNGTTTHIIAIVLRGTKEGDVADILTDIGAFGDEFEKSANYTYELLETYIKGCSLNAGEITKDNVKFFVTGHSLGGAVSNILAKKLNDTYGKSNVFAYTFAAPRSINTTDTSENENIYNILNAEDFVPLENFATRGKKRFGKAVWFSRLNYEKDIYDNFRVITNGRDLKPIMGVFTNPINIIMKFNYGHSVEMYMAYLYSRRDSPYIAPDNIKELQCRCPVDLEIYVDNGTENGLLVGRVTNNVVDESVTPGVYIRVVDDVKYISLIYEGDYTIKLMGTDTGSMEYIAQDINLNTDEVVTEKSFKNVVLSNGKQMSSAVSVWNKNDDTMDAEEKIDTPEVPLYVLDSDGNPEKEILPDGNGTEVYISRTITFDANGGSISPATAITGNDGKMSNLPIPVRNGATFEGWFTEAIGGEQITMNTIFTNDSTLYAHWRLNSADEKPDDNKPDNNKPNAPSTPSDDNSSNASDNNTTSNITTNTNTNTDTSTTATKQTTKSPKTGDSSFVIWLYAMGISVMVLLIIRYKKKNTCRR